jgi:hypothetical protein
MRRLPQRLKQPFWGVVLVFHGGSWPASGAVAVAERADGFAQGYA